MARIGRRAEPYNVRGAGREWPAACCLDRKLDYARARMTADTSV